MLYVIVGLGLLFIGIGFLITEKNAKHLLSGYNTLPQTEQEKVELGPYLKYFKKFHIFLGVSLIVLYLLLTHLLGEDVGGIFLGVYPLLAYTYFIGTGHKYFKQVKSGRKQTIIGFLVLTVTIFFVGGIFFYGYQEDELVWDSDHIELEGFYGEKLKAPEIRSVQLIDTLPVITIRSNGFSSGSVHKGYFKTKGGKEIKLILNSENEPYIWINTKDGRDIYYSARKNKNREIYGKVKSTFPELEYRP